MQIFMIICNVAKKTIKNKIELNWTVVSSKIENCYVSSVEIIIIVYLLFFITLFSSQKNQNRHLFSRGVTEENVHSDTKIWKILGYVISFSENFFHFSNFRKIILETLNLHFGILFEIIFIGINFMNILILLTLITIDSKNIFIGQLMKKSTLIWESWVFYIYSILFQKQLLHWLQMGAPRNKLYYVNIWIIKYTCK